MVATPTPLANGVLVPYAFLKPTTFAKLPVANSGFAGYLAIISDCNTSTPGAVAAGGGSTVAHVWWNGTSWLVVGAALSASGLPGAPLRLTEAKTAAGVGAAATASGGNMGISLTPGTSLFLVGEATASGSKTDVAVFDVVLPSTYVPGQNVTVTVHSQYVVGSGAASGTNTIAAAAYLNTAAGAQGATLIATAAHNISASDAAYTFTITGTTLVPGSYLTLELTLVVTNGTGASTGQVNSVALS